MSKRPFTRSRHTGGVECHLRSEDREFVADLCEGLAERLRARGGSSADDLAGPAMDDESALFAQLADLGRTEPLPPPGDAVLARLLPDAVRDDEEASAEFRRLSEADLRRSKQHCLDVAAAALRGPGPKLLLDAEQTQCLLKALNDLRLAHGAVLGLQSDEDAELMEAALEAADAAPDDDAVQQLGLDPRWVAVAQLYEVLGHWQAVLLDCLTD